MKHLRDVGKEGCINTVFIKNTINCSSGTIQFASQPTDSSFLTLQLFLNALSNVYHATHSLYILIMCNEKRRDPFNTYLIIRLTAKQTMYTNKHEQSTPKKGMNLIVSCSCVRMIWRLFDDLEHGQQVQYQNKL